MAVAKKRARKNNPAVIRGGLTIGSMATEYTGKGGALPGGKAKRGFARTFGQDIMRGEHKVGASKRKPNTRAVGTQDWVQQKIAAGDIEGGNASGQSGTSIFDPVLCELVYRWFCPPGGLVLDPFAGGSVRGIVASRLGRRYLGIELRPEQIAANRAQIGIAGDLKPEWRQGDSTHLAKIAGDAEADLVFSCPPYWNLEVYSEDERDISTMGREEFFDAQAKIIAAAIGRLKRDRFAAWVVGDVRDDSGAYVNIPGRTVQAFEAAGARLYNEAILITAAGSLPVRVGKQFVSGRKLGKTHQNVLVFVKGDWRKAVKAVGEVEFGDIAGDQDQPADPAGGNHPAAEFGAIL